MKIDIITIFPDIFDSYFNESIIKRAKEAGLVSIYAHNLRDYATDKHQTVDDTPYGGGAGMVMKIEPIYKAVEDIKSKNDIDQHGRRIVLFSAKGKRYTQDDAKRLAGYENIIMICGRYEGIDERVIENIADEEISIGDFVLTGGELPAMIVADSVARLLPGVLGNSESLDSESHNQEGVLEYPQYTKPENFMDLRVPEVLLSGNHQKIEQWRNERKSKPVKNNS